MTDGDGRGWKEEESSHRRKKRRGRGRKGGL